MDCSCVRSSFRSCVRSSFRSFRSFQSFDSCTMPEKKMEKVLYLKNCLVCRVAWPHSISLLFSLMDNDTQHRRHVIENASSTSSQTPYNTRNRLLQEHTLYDILRRYGNDHPVRDVSLYRKALTHRSYCTRKNENFVDGNVACPPGCLPLQEHSNETLEFLGDAVLNLVTASYLFERYPDENEGFLTRMRTKLVNGVKLAELCRAAGIGQYFVISRQIEEGHGRMSKKVLEDCFESFLGAMFVDAGYPVTYKWLVCFLESHVDFPSLVATHQSYKGNLTEYLKKAYNEMPCFTDVAARHVLATATAATAGGNVSENGSGSGGSEEIDNFPEYTVCVSRRDGLVLSTGSGHTKKDAENEAARKALLYCGQLV